MPAQPQLSSRLRLCPCSASLQDWTYLSTGTFQITLELWDIKGALPSCLPVAAGCMHLAASLGQGPASAVVCCTLQLNPHPAALLLLLP